MGLFLDLDASDIKITAVSALRHAQRQALAGLDYRLSAIPLAPIFIC